MSDSGSSDFVPPPMLIDTNAKDMEELMERFVQFAYRESGRAIVHSREGRPKAAMSIVENLHGVLGVFLATAENTRFAEQTDTPTPPATP